MKKFNHRYYDLIIGFMGLFLFLAVIISAYQLTVEKPEIGKEKYTDISPQKNSFFITDMSDKTGTALENSQPQRVVSLSEEQVQQKDAYQKELEKWQKGCLFKPDQLYTHESLRDIIGRKQANNRDLYNDLFF